jgi:hypothetical protein
MHSLPPRYRRAGRPPRPLLARAGSGVRLEWRPGGGGELRSGSSSLAEQSIFILPRSSEGRHGLFHAFTCTALCTSGE